MNENIFKRRIPQFDFSISYVGRLTSTCMLQRNYEKKIKKMNWRVSGKILHKPNNHFFFQELKVTSYSTLRTQFRTCLLLFQNLRYYKTFQPQYSVHVLWKQTTQLPASTTNLGWQLIMNEKTLEILYGQIFIPRIL